MTRFIDDHRSYGIEPICRTLAIAPSSYYASKVRPPSSRAIRDEALSADLSPIHAEHFSVYGVRKVWRVLRREGFEVGRDQVRRLMRRLGLAGETRTKRVRTTRPALASARPADLVERVFSAAAPNRLIYPVVGSMMAATSTGDRRPAIRQMTVAPSVRRPTSGPER